MSDSNGHKKFLVDPDLLVPDEDHVKDYDFWARLNNWILAIREYGMIGIETGQLFDDFLVEIFNRGPGVVSNGAISDDWFYNNIYPKLSGVYRMAAPGESHDSASIGEDIYIPSMGNNRCRDALEADLPCAADAVIIADKHSWHSFCGGLTSIPAIADVYDIKDGLHLCARLSIQDNLSYSTCQSVSNDAFPNLEYCKEAWDFSQSFRSNEASYAPLLVQFFSGLNDYACDCWKQTTEASERKRRLKAKFVYCSPEKEETMQIESCRRERTFHLENDREKRDFVMSWHLKFRHDEGRLYFSVETNPSRVVIGGNMKHGKTTKSGVHRKRTRRRGNG